MHHMALPLKHLLEERTSVIEYKNRTLFAHTIGFPHLTADDLDHVLATFILLFMGRYNIPDCCRAVGEKTPENVFFFSRLSRVFPAARFIGIVRDPRDVITSAWHFFGKSGALKLEEFVHAALPSLRAGLETLLAFSECNLSACRIVSYEELRQQPIPVLTDLFRFLNVSVDGPVLASIVSQTQFDAVLHQNESNDVHLRRFCRKGVVGDWCNTLSPEISCLIKQEFTSFFSRFGWTG